MDALRRTKDRQVKTMAAKMLETVLAKEKSVDEQEQRAKENAEETVADANLKARAILDEAARQADEYERKTLSEAEKNSAELLELSRREAEAMAKLLKQQATSQLSRAVGVVKDIIVQ